MTAVECEEVRAVADLTVHGEWRQNLARSEGVGAVEVEEILEADDRLRCELVDGREAEIGEEWRETFEGVE